MDKPTILLVDDDPDIIETVRFSLEQEGYAVITAADGVEALTRAQEIEPDLMVLDVMMPKENGYRVARMIREDEAAGRISKKIPIVLLTARDLQGEPDRERMFMEFSGADAVIYKPFEMDDLVQLINRYLRSS